MFRRYHYKFLSHALKHMNKNPKTDNVALKIRKEAKMYLSAKSKLMHYSIIEHMSLEKARLRAMSLQVPKQMKIIAETSQNSTSAGEKKLVVNLAVATTKRKAICYLMVEI